MHTRLFIVVLLVAAALSETIAGGFGKLPVSARAVTFGGTLVSLQDDPNVLFTNPAGIASLSGISISSSYTQLFLGITDDKLSYLSGSAVANLGFAGNLGIGVSTFRSNTWKEGTLIGSYAQNLFDIVMVGGSVKLLYWSAAAPAGRLAVAEPPMTKTTLSFDAGAQAKFANIFPENDIILGMGIQDLTQPSIAVNGSADAKLDRATSVGVSYVSRALEYIVMLQFVNAGTVNRYALGVEIIAVHGHVAGQSVSFTVRGGGGTASQPEQQGDLFGGFGVDIANFKLDYAFGQPTQIRSLAGTHHVTLRTTF